MPKKGTLTAERVRELLDYDPATGVFRWKRRRKGVRSDGAIAGSPADGYYTSITVDRVQYLVHRLAWLYMYGVWPVSQLDHINEDKTDNRLANLREATNAQNTQNVTALRSTNTSGYLGVSWECRKRRWQAGIKVDGKRRWLGYFDTPEEAHAAYLVAKRELHPFWQSE